MDCEFLTKVKAEEREIKDVFSEALPYYYWEIAQRLLNECKDDFVNYKQTKSLIEDLFELRKEKLVRVLKRIDPETPVHYLSSASAAEINYVRPAFTSAYSVVNKM